MHYEGIQADILELFDEAQSNSQYVSSYSESAIRYVRKCRGSAYRCTFCGAHSPTHQCAMTSKPRFVTGFKWPVTAGRLR